MEIPEEQGPPGVLRLSLFGTFETYVDGRPLPRLRSRAGQWLLALLVLRSNRSTERIWLAATLWPDSSEDQALYNLRRNLTDLRRILGSHACRLTAPTPRTIRLDLNGAECDLISFDRASRQLAPGAGSRDAQNDPALAEAVHLYRGPFLEQCREEWAIPERRLREQMYVRALEALAGSTQASGDVDSAISYFKRIVAIEPLRESAVRGLMGAFTAKGDYAGSIQAYRDLRLLLHDELSVEPDTETASLYRELRARARDGMEPARHAVVESVPTLRHLPEHLSTFVGREAEKRQVMAELANARLVTLTGAGGVGKSRLAVAVAEEVIEEFRDGACLVELAPVDDPAGVAQAAATALDLRGSGPPLDTLLDYLRSRELLLILDNCEHLASACGSLCQTLLGECPHLRVLATSRESLGVSGEHAWRVPSLSLPEQLDDEALSDKGAQALLMESEAAQLFVVRAREANSAFRLTRENLASVALICVLLDGIPLAIEFAAAWSRMMPVAETTARLRDRLDLLQSRRPGKPARQQTLRETLDWSYGLLTPQEQRLLRCLSVFSGGWTLEAAESVCGSSPPAPPPILGEGSVLMQLSGLVDKSLVEYREQFGRGRFRLLETTRQYAREKLVEHGEAEAATRRHAAYFVKLAEETEPRVSGTDQAEAIAMLDEEQENFLSALASCTHSGPPCEALRFTAALWRFWEIRGYFRLGREIVERTLTVEHACNDLSLRAKSLTGAAHLAYGTSDYSAAQKFWEGSLAIRRKLGDLKGIGKTLSNLGDIYGMRGEMLPARTNYEEALIYSRQAGDGWVIALTLAKLGWAAGHMEDYTTSMRALEESLDVAREVGDPSIIAFAMMNMGQALQFQSEYSTARELHSEALSLFREVQDRPGEALCYHGLATCATYLSDFDTAESYHNDCLLIWRELGARHGIAGSHNDRAITAAHFGAMRRAAVLRAASQTVYRSIGCGSSPYAKSTEDEELASARRCLGDSAVEAAIAEGRSMTMEQAIEYALSDADRRSFKDSRAMI